jgi:hypothetical protein
MKTRKHFFGMAFVAIIAIAVIGCKQEPTPQDDSIGSVTIGGKTIKVYKDADVSDADANTTLQNLQGVNDLLSNSAKAFVAANVTKVEIGGTGVTLNAGTLRIQAKITVNGIAINLENIYTASL